MIFFFVLFRPADFDYLDDPSVFQENLEDALGPDYPYFASIGNHDLDSWTEYQANLVARLKRFGGDKNCTGDYGVNMACRWNGIYFVLSGAGTRGSNHANFIDSTFTGATDIWKFVSWHKNQRLMQIGGKSDETGWAVYDTTREHGAIIATGHEHSYCRSYTMSDIEEQDIVSTNSTLNLKVGETFVFVSGLGGKDIRTWETALESNPWWAATGASNNGISDGALLCTFNVDGDARKASCTFRDRLGKTWDSFDIISQLPSTQEELAEQLAAAKSKTAAKCRSRWIEVPVTRANSDAQERLTGELDCAGKIAHLGKAKATAIHFDNVPLQKGDVIEEAFLQVYSANDASESTHRYVISGSGNKGGRFSCKRRAGLRQLSAPERKLTSSSVVWEHEDEGWEKHTVWVTPNISEVVSEIINDEEWAPENGITLNLAGSGDGSFYTYDRSPCHAPTLALKIKAVC